MFFLPCGWIGLLIFSRNEKKQCANLWVDSKKCDRKKQQQGGCAEAGIKTVQAPLRQAQRPTSTGSAPIGHTEPEKKGRGFISGWGKKPAELPVIELQP